MFQKKYLFVVLLWAQPAIIQSAGLTAMIPVSPNFGEKNILLRCVNRSLSASCCRVCGLGGFQMVRSDVYDREWRKYGELYQQTAPVFRNLQEQMQWHIEKEKCAAGIWRRLCADKQLLHDAIAREGCEVENLRSWIIKRWMNGSAEGNILLHNLGVHGQNIENTKKSLSEHLAHCQHELEVCEQKQKIFSDQLSNSVRQPRKRSAQAQLADSPKKGSR
jgi:hypothetical protein